AEDQHLIRIAHRRLRPSVSKIGKHHIHISLYFPILRNQNGRRPHDLGYIQPDHPMKAGFHQIDLHIAHEGYGMPPFEILRKQLLAVRPETGGDIDPVIRINGLFSMLDVPVSCGLPPFAASLTLPLPFSPVPVVTALMPSLFVGLPPYLAFLPFSFPFLLPGASAPEKQHDPDKYDHDGPDKWPGMKRGIIVFSQAYRSYGRDDQPGKATESPGEADEYPHRRHQKVPVEQHIRDKKQPLFMKKQRGARQQQEQARPDPPRFMSFPIVHFRYIFFKTTLKIPP